jgi:ATP-dependent DNA ligase
LFVTPMAAQAVKALPKGDGWLYEVKWDGYRALLIKDGRQVQLRSRNDKDLMRMYPTVAAAGLQLKAERIVLDGEIVALGPDGRPSVQALQHRGSHAKHEIVFYAFDVLSLNGRDLTANPLTKRREQLQKIMTADPVVRISQDLPGSVADIVKTLRAAGIEGVIAKRRESPYQPGDRSGDWVKFEARAAAGICDRRIFARWRQQSRRRPGGLLRRRRLTVRRQGAGGRSSRQGCNSAGESPAASIARFGCEAIPRPGAGNQAGSCVV